MGDLDELKSSEVTGYRLQVGFEPYSLYREDLLLFIIYSFDFLFASSKESQITFFFFLKKVPPHRGGSKSNPQPATSNLLKRNNLKATNILI